MNFGWHLNTVIVTSTEMTVASRAVAMAVMTEARTVDVEQEGHTLHSWTTVVSGGAVSGGRGVVVSGGRGVVVSGGGGVVVSCSRGVVMMASCRQVALS